MIQQDDRRKILVRWDHDMPNILSSQMILSRVVDGSIRGFTHVLSNALKNGHAPSLASSHYQNFVSNTNQCEGKRRSLSFLRIPVSSVTLHEVRKIPVGHDITGEIEIEIVHVKLSAE